MAGFETLLISCYKNSKHGIFICLLFVALCMKKNDLINLFRNPFFWGLLLLMLYTLYNFEKKKSSYMLNKSFERIILRFSLFIGMNAKN